MSDTNVAPEKTAKKNETVLVSILRDYWGDPKPDGTENRVAAGTMLEVSKDECMDLLEKGMAARVKTGG